MNGGLFHLVSQSSADWDEGFLLMASGRGFICDLSFEDDFLTRLAKSLNNTGVYVFSTGDFLIWCHLEIYISVQSSYLD